MKVHTFNAADNRDGDEWWATFYARCFAGYQSHEVVTDIERQKAGIDHVVTVEGRGQIFVDAKVRENYYPDILVEVHSAVYADGRKTPGWALKPLQCHYIAYVFPAQGVGYLLPFALLQLAYQRHKLQWAAAAKDRDTGFRVVSADNGTYRTVSVVVPLAALRAALAASMEVYFYEDYEPFGEAS